MISPIENFLNILALNLKTFARQKMRIASFFMLIALLCLGAGLAGNFFVSGQNIINPIYVAVVDLDNSFETGLILSAITESTENDGLLSFAYHSPESAADALSEGSVVAIITLPENFGIGITTGENIPFTVTYNQNMPLISALVRISADAFADMLRISQTGVYITLNYAAAMDLPQAQYDMIFLGVNMRFLGFVLNRDKMFVTDTLSVTGGLLIWQAYFIAAYISLMMCAAFVMTDTIRRNFNRFSLISLKNRGIPSYMIFGACVTAYFLLFAALNTGLWLFSNILLTVFYMPPFILNAALLLAVFVVITVLSSFAAMLTFVFDSPLSAGVFTAVFAGLSFFLSGGIIPIALFSDGMQIVSNLVWNTWAASLLAAALTEGLIGWAAIAICASFGLVFAAIGCIAAGKRSEVQK
ncbi:MAG: ABC transporter permease [Defluviitaleaceae bacterium]|nr:ABC transporter permease [Defluviitaleaceae bacterium]